MATARETDVVASMRIEFIEQSDGTPLEPELAEATQLWMRENTNDGLMYSWFAEDDGEPIGVVTVRIRDASPRRDDLIGKEAYVHNLYVRDAYRGKGVGRELMQALLGWCKSNGYPRVALRATEMGRPLYEKLGFVPDRAMIYKAPANH